MEYTAMKTDRHRHNLNTICSIYFVQGHTKYLLNLCEIKKCTSKWHFMHRIHSSLFTRTSKSWSLSHNSTLTSNTSVSTKSTPLLVRMLHCVERVLIYITQSCSQIPSWSSSWHPSPPYNKISQTPVMNVTFYL
jgi:hypothetical protein